MTKLETYVVRFHDCRCLRNSAGCSECNFTGKRITHVPLADAIKEIEEENARLYLEGVSQTPTVGKSPNYLEMCNKCGGASFRVYKDGPVHCEACDYQLLKEN